MNLPATVATLPKYDLRDVLVQFLVGTILEQDHGHNAPVKYKDCEFTLELMGIQGLPFPTRQIALGLKGAFQDPNSLLRSFLSNLLQKDTSSPPNHR